MQSWNLHEIETPGGSISPVVLDSDDAARVVLIGLDPGQELGEHQVKEHALVLVVDGTVRVEAGGESLEAPSGHALHLRARRAALGLDRRRRPDPALPRAVAGPGPLPRPGTGRDFLLALPGLALRQRLAGALQVSAVHRAVHQVHER